jgi:hypothetical protein
MDRGGDQRRPAVMTARQNCHAGGRSFEALSSGRAGRPIQGPRRGGADSQDPELFAHRTHSFKRFRVVGGI